MSENAGDFTGHAEAWAMNHGQTVELTTTWQPIAFKPTDAEGRTDWQPIAPFTYADYDAVRKARNQGEVVTTLWPTGEGWVLQAALAPEVVRVQARRNGMIGTASGFVRRVA